MDSAAAEYAAQHQQAPSPAPPPSHGVNGFSHPLPQPQPPPAPSDTPVQLIPTADDYARELPQVLADLVPLGFIVERIASQAFADLSNLAET